MNLKQIRLKNRTITLDSCRFCPMKHGIIGIAGYRGVLRKNGVECSLRGTINELTYEIPADCQLEDYGTVDMDTVVKEVQQ